MKPQINKKAVLIGVLILTLGLGFFFKKKNDEKREQLLLQTAIAQLKDDIDKNRAQLVSLSFKRSEVQMKMLKDTKSLNLELEKLFTQTNQIPFVQQDDFNIYEQKQNEIQNVVTKKIIDGLKSKDKKWQQYFQKNMKQLELVERDLNQVRMKFSESVYDLAAKENKKAVTFLSDTALIENRKVKN